MRTRSRLVGAFIAGAVVPGVLVGGAAVAQTDDPPETITACIQGQVLQVPDENGECKGNAEPITWNVEGPEGPAGPQGPEGPAGPGSGVAVVSIEVDDNAPEGPVTVRDANGFLGAWCTEATSGQGFCNFVMPLGLQLDLRAFGPPGPPEGETPPVPATWGGDAANCGTAHACSITATGDLNITATIDA